MNTARTRLRHSRRAAWWLAVFVRGGLGEQEVAHAHPRRAFILSGPAMAGVGASDAVLTPAPPPLEQGGAL